MIEKCSKCNMLRAEKDLVRLEDDSIICFSCWNKLNQEKEEKSK